MSGSLTARPLVLDAATPSNDENARLRPGGPIALTPDNARFSVTLEAYGIGFWSFEQRK